MTFDDWYHEQPKSFKRHPFEAKLRAAWEAGRIEGWIQAYRVQQFQYRLTTPRYSRIPQDLDLETA